MWTALNVKPRRLKFTQQITGRPSRFLREAAADHFRRHRHFTSSCCPWESGPLPSPCQGEGGIERSGMWSAGGSLASAGDILSCSLSALGMLCPGQSQAALGTAQGVPTEELV